jgi:hypothetical protein
MRPFVDFDEPPALGRYDYRGIYVESYLSDIHSRYGFNTSVVNPVDAFIKEAQQPSRLDDVFRSNTFPSFAFSRYDYHEFNFEDDSAQSKRPRKSNEFGYKFGNVYNMSIHFQKKSSA